MLNKILLLALLIGLGILGCSQTDLPTADEVNSLIQKYAGESGRSQKVDILKDLLSNLSNPQNVSDDKIVENALEKLAKTYRDNHDEAILIAVDETKIDGGFANFVCEFYLSLKSEKQFKDRYRKEPKALERCVGISFDSSEIRDL